MQNKQSQVAYNKYKQVQVGTANKGNLLIMLYQGCIKFLRLSVQSIEDGKIEDANIFLIKAQNIIEELMNSLNLNKGGEIASNLYSLYDFMKNELINANINKNTEKIKIVINMIEELLETWQEIIIFKKDEKDNLKVNVNFNL